MPRAISRGAPGGTRADRVRPRGRARRRTTRRRRPCANGRPSATRGPARACSIVWSSTRWFAIAATYGESDAPSTDVSSTPFLIIIAANGVPARWTGSTIRCRHATGAPLLVESPLDAVDGERTVVPAAHVVLARPDELDGSVDALRDMGGLRDEIRDGVRAPAETAAEERRVDRHLLGLQAEDARDVLLVHRLELRPRPDLAAFGGLPDRAVESLHRGVREVRDRILGHELSSRGP